MPHNMLLATCSCAWGFLCAYGFAYFDIGFKAAYKIFGGIFLVISFLLSVLYLHQYFRRRSMTYWGSGLALILAVLPLLLTLSASSSGVCHESAAKWTVLAFAFAAGPLLLYGLFHLVEHRTEGQKVSGESATADADVNHLILSLLLLLVFHLIGDEKTQAGNKAESTQGMDKEELKNFTLLLTLYLSLYIFGRRFILQCWS